LKGRDKEVRGGTKSSRKGSGERLSEDIRQGGGRGKACHVDFSIDKIAGYKSSGGKERGTTWSWD